MTASIEVTRGIRIGSRVIQRTKVYTSDFVDSWEFDIADGQTDRLCNVHIAYPTVELIFFLSSQDVLVEWNDNAGSSGSISLKANVPWLWIFDDTGNVSDLWPQSPTSLTALYVTNASGETATIQIETLNPQS